MTLTKQGARSKYTLSVPMNVFGHVDIFMNALSTCDVLDCSYSISGTSKYADNTLEDLSFHGVDASCLLCGTCIC